MIASSIPRYYPVMLLKQGEMNGLSEVNKLCDSWFTPLFNAVPDSFWKEVREPNRHGKMVRAKNDDGTFKKEPRNYRATIENLADKLHESWRHEYPLMLDGQLLTGTIDHDSELHPFYDLVEAVMRREMSVIPVTGINSKSRNNAYQEAVKKRIEIDRRGVCFRLSPQDVKLPNIATIISAFVKMWELEKKEVTIFLDYGYIKQKVNFVPDIKKIPFLSEWRRVVVGAGAFPAYEDNKSAFVADSSPRFPRLDLASWKEAFNSDELASLRVIDFADYTCRNPIFTPLLDMKSQPASKITWTTEGEFVHERGHQPKKGEKQFTMLAENLFAQEGIEESLIDFCEADKFLKSIDEGTPNGTIGQTLQFWIGKSAEHHITLTTLQMLDFAGYGLQDSV